MFLDGIDAWAIRASRSSLLGPAVNFTWERCTIEMTAPAPARNNLLPCWANEMSSWSRKEQLKFQEQQAVATTPDRSIVVMIVTMPVWLMDCIIYEVMPIEPASRLSSRPGLRKPALLGITYWDWK